MLNKITRYCAPQSVVNLSAAVSECLMSTRDDSVLAVIAVLFLSSNKRSRHIHFLGKHLGSKEITGIASDIRKGAIALV